MSTLDQFAIDALRNAQAAAALAEGARHNEALHRLLMKGVFLLEDIAVSLREAADDAKKGGYDKPSDASL